jgi:transcriptional regulator with XRE-family HTH domain
MEIFAQRLKEERKKANLTQQNMADKLNITRGAYAQYENNMTEPSIETLAKITNILKTSADYLIGRY